MKANKFVKKFGVVSAGIYLDQAHVDATHIYVGWNNCASYFYNHQDSGWHEVDKRTQGWDSDRCCYDVHPPISSMVSIAELKNIVESHKLIECYGGLESSKSTVNYPNFLNDEDVEATNHRLSKAVADVESCM